ncbi:hypothetical protein B9Z55_020545 [Caenorhabditis nigoni]|uniref:CUB domain-containing protein n=1 Tax=Caenorhabditis nigoni TaxID=1611254 RepID=A0A2G5TNB3_9PELO|nr:hypothetical protein B9Z55_020545 [Caenorhabditis nigoni]
MILFFIFLLFLSAISPDNECPYRYRFYADTAICYHLSDDLYDFDGAVRYCEGTGGKLVSLIQGERAGIASEPNPTNGDCVTFKGVASNFGLQTTQCYQQQYAFCKIVPDLCNGGIQNGTFGSIQSPQYPNQYYNKLMCLYYIYAPQGFRVNIYFPQIQTEKNYDFVEIYEKNSTLYPDRIVGLSGNLTDYTYQSNGSFLLVVFRTNYVITDIGFYATWNVERIQPLIISNTTNSGELTSPNYPEDYDTFDKQLYYIQVAEGGRINVTIDDFLTQETFDYLDIFDSFNQSSKVVRLSGNSVAPWSWFSTSNVVSLKFVSDGSYQYKGWHLTWNMI